jgi:hypothetical protein
MPKLGAEAFLYLSPEPDTPDFAQCSSCRDWVKGDNLCAIHGPFIEVLGSMSCGLYVYGEPLPEGSRTMTIVSTLESGLVDREVRCENCKHMLPDDICGFFDTLNKELPELFDIDTNIDPKGSCNAQQSS